MNAAGSELILLVCSANVCRSPLAENLLRWGLVGLSGVRVASAGTKARVNSTVCPLVAERGADDEWGREMLAHRSRPLTAEVLAEATLILTAARDIRSEVVRLAPEARDRTYTLLEAAHLGKEFAPGSPHPRRIGTISRYAMHLDGARAVRGLVPARPSRWWRVRGADGRDIVDGHTRSAREHRGTVQEVVEVTATILGQLGGRTVTAG